MGEKKVNFTTYILSMVIVALAVMVIMLLINKDSGKQTANEDTKTEIQNNEITNNNVADEKEQNNKNEVDSNINNSSTGKVEINPNSEDYIFLYKGCEIQKNIGIQTVSEMNKSAENMKKYNIVYYNFERGRYIGETQGAFGTEEVYEGYSVVNNVNKFAISKKYNAIPRAYSILNELPRYLNDESKFPAQEKENGEKISVNLEDIRVIQVDLDGDLRKEYIVFWKLDIKQGEYEDSKAEASSGFMLFDSGYSKISDLCSINKKFENNEQKSQQQVFFNLDNIDFIDINNDGIMEIIIDIPAYEGQKIGIYSYNGGKIEGEINYEVSLEP